jgi:hypothetical protein
MSPRFPLSAGSVLALLAMLAGAAQGFTHGHIGNIRGVGNGRYSTHTSLPEFKHLGRWCCLNEAEFVKCEAWRVASNHTDTMSNVLLECVRGSDKFDCYKKIFNDEADLMSADAGEVYTAGKFYNLMPLTNEVYASPTGQNYEDQYTVAVVKKGWKDRLGNGKCFTLHTIYSGLLGIRTSLTILVRIERFIFQAVRWKL